VVRCMKLFVDKLVERRSKQTATEISSRFQHTLTEQLAISNSFPGSVPSTRAQLVGITSSGTKEYPALEDWRLGMEVELELVDIIGGRCLLFGQGLPHKLAGCGS
jgi:hypothetical protein